MLTPEQMDDAGGLVATVYRQIEAELLEYLVAKMAEGDVSGQRAQTAVALLSQSMPLELKKAIDAHADELDGAARADVERALSASDAWDLAAISEGLGVTLAADALAAQTLAVTASVRGVIARDNVELNAAARSAYMRWTSWAATQVATGNMTAEKAKRRAVRELARGGLAITWIQYRDPETGERTVRNRADVAVQRHVRTLIAQGAARLTMRRCEESGCGFVEVSSHFGARPSHAEWHGRCYHLGGAVEVDGVRYEDFHEGTGYEGLSGPYTALGDQLLGVNCRHSFAPWMPGMPRAYSPDPWHPSGLSNDEAYALTQRQRAIEREIRDDKREAAAAQALYDASPTPENQVELAKAKLKLRNRQERMREFIRESNAKCKPGTEVLVRQPQREWAGDMPKVGGKSYAASSINTRSGFAKSNWKFEREYGAVYDKRGRLIPGTVTEGVPGRVMIKEPPGGWKDTRVVHTHDGDFGGCFSVGTKEGGDLYHMLDADLIGYDAICREGVYEITRTRDVLEVERKKFLQEARAVELQVERDESDNIVEEWTSKGRYLNNENLQLEFDTELKRRRSNAIHRWLVENADRFGYRYRFTAHDEVK